MKYLSGNRGKHRGGFPAGTRVQAPTLYEPRLSGWRQMQYVPRERSSRADMTGLATLRPRSSGNFSFGPRTDAVWLEDWQSRQRSPALREHSASTLGFVAVLHRRSSLIIYVPATSVWLLRTAYPGH